ncbi:MAG: FkbM family methyltransferase [Dyadobacter fermentans]
MSLKDLHHYFSKKNSYSQHGEDMILMSYFNHDYKGFFVDVGAHHPFRFSNTYSFYRRGWRGINIDAKPGVKKLFDRVRPNDINLELGIAGEEGSLTFYMFDEPALNSFSKELSEERNENTRYKIIDTKDVMVRRLSKVLEEHIPTGQNIDFLTVDVEGLDIEVLESNDWERFRPSMVVVEDLDLDLQNLHKSAVYESLFSKGYVLVGKTLASLIFKSNR